MKRPGLENSLGLPLPLVRAIEHDEYDRGDSEFTTTELDLPPKILALRRLHAPEITQDVSDMIFTLFGRAIHTVLEKAADERYIVEKRFFVEHDGVKLSGQIDLYDKEQKVLQDWKITSRWVAVEGPKPEWIAQQNVNRYILFKNGFDADKCQNVLIYRDWSKIQAGKGGDYPARQVEIVDIPLWPKHQVLEYLGERISLHRAALNAESNGRNGGAAICNPRERWARPTRYAVMRKGYKKAIKLYDTEDEAKGAANQSPGLFVEERAGVDQRCMYYCDVARWCPHGREVLAADNL